MEFNDKQLLQGLNCTQERGNEIWKENQTWIQMPMLCLKGLLGPNSRSLDHLRRTSLQDHMLCYTANYGNNYEISICLTRFLKS